MRKFFAAVIATIMLCSTFSYAATAAPADPPAGQVKVLKARVAKLKAKNADLTSQVSSLNSSVSTLTDKVTSLQANLDYNSPEACKARPLCFNTPAFPANKVTPEDKVTYRVFFVARAFGNDYQFYAGPYFNRYAANAAVSDLSTYRYIVPNSIRLEQSATVWTTVSE